MDELQRYVEENLPDRFRGMKVFRVPVLSDSILYWASYNNGNWSFVKATSNVTPLLIHNSMSKYGALYEKESDPVDDEEEDEIQELEVEEEQPKGRRPVKEKPARPVKEKPVKKEKPAKPERPVKERPARPERPAKKEKPVKEKPPKKERPVRERPSKRRNEEELEELNINMNEEEEFENSFDVPMQSPMNSNYSFVKDKVRKKLTGRIIFSVLFLILSAFTNIFFTWPVISNSIKANKNINNPVEYWHYRGKSSYLHTLNVLSFLLIFILAIIVVVMTLVAGVSLSLLFSDILGGLM